MITQRCFYKLNEANTTDLMVCGVGEGLVLVGKPKEHSEKRLCTYCYFRGVIGTMKLLILNRLSKEEDEHFTLEDIKDYLDTLPYVKVKFNPASLSRLLWRYTDLGLVTARKERRKRIGRSRLTYKITKKGKKRLKQYLKRWELGLVAILSTSKKHRFRMTVGYRERATAIRGQLKKQSDIFEYILPNKQ